MDEEYPLLKTTYTLFEVTMIEPIKIDSQIEIHTVSDLKKYRSIVQKDITFRLSQFKEMKEMATPGELFRELVFCILTANASAKMALRSINTLDSLIYKGAEKDIENRLRGVYRFPKVRANYIVRSRDFLQSYCQMNIRKILNEFTDQFLLREFLVKNIVGIGFKECSHFLRNIGYSGYAILDKHVISMLNLLDCSVRKPRSKREYCEIEKIMISFAKRIKIDIDELDLLFWSYKTGEIIK